MPTAISQCNRDLQFMVILIFTTLIDNTISLIAPSYIVTLSPSISFVVVWQPDSSMQSHGWCLGAFFGLKSKARGWFKVVAALFNHDQMKEVCLDTSICQRFYLVKSLLSWLNKSCINQNMKQLQLQWCIPCIIKASENKKVQLSVA